MKLRLLTSGAAILLLSAFTFSSLSEKDLIGSWKVDDAYVSKTVKKIIDKAVAANPDAEDQIEAQKDMIISLVKEIRLNIKADHTYESVSPQGTNPGKWLVLDNGRTIQFTKNDGSVRKDSVLESSATRLKLINRDLGDTILYIHP